MQVVKLFSLIGLNRSNIKLTSVQFVPLYVRTGRGGLSEGGVVIVDGEQDDDEDDDDDEAGDEDPDSCSDFSSSN